MNSDSDVTLASTPSARLLHALTFDVEEFFQVANLRHQFTEADWDQTPSRLDVGMDAILGALERHDSRATFFFLGWVAERRPDLVQRCVKAGHEIASHGYRHLFLGDLGPSGLDEDLARTEEVLMAAGAPRPKGFRASTFTLTRETFWAVEILAKRGYVYDSSIHPVSHPTYGIPDFEPGLSHIQTKAGSLVEFPVATYPFGGRNLPMGGGGYFRLLPGPVTRMALASLEKRGRHASIYLHPWEFDPGQPKQPAPFLKKFRHYVGLSKTLPRMERLLERFRFGTMQQVLEEAGFVDSEATP